MVGRIQRTNTVDKLQSAKNQIGNLETQVKNFIEGCYDEGSKAFQKHETHIDFAKMLLADVDSIYNTLYDVKTEAEKGFQKHLEHEAQKEKD